MAAPILFYRTKEAFGVFSNFSRHQVTVFDRTWATSEHPYQAMKFYPHRPDLVDEVWAAESPTIAAGRGRDPTKPLNPWWDTRIDRCVIPAILTVPKYSYGHMVDDGRNGPEPAVEYYKDLVMLQVVLAKFSQPALKKILLSTGDAPLIENALHDPYWGWGSSRTGMNRLGKILMTVRKILSE